MHVFRGNMAVTKLNPWQQHAWRDMTSRATYKEDAARFFGVWKAEGIAERKVTICSLKHTASAFGNVGSLDIIVVVLMPETIAIRIPLLLSFIMRSVVLRHVHKQSGRGAATLQSNAFCPQLTLSRMHMEEETHLNEMYPLPIVDEGTSLQVLICLVLLSLRTPTPAALSSRRTVTPCFRKPCL